MKKIIWIILAGLAIAACDNNQPSDFSSMKPENWDKRSITPNPSDTFETGKTYLSVYSQIYSRTEHRTHDLTVTVSMRNTSTEDTVYIKTAEYFNTHGHCIRTYFSKTIFIAPMETVEIVIDEKDQEGGTGANFVFDWMIRSGSEEPLFEGIMISTSGQQGLSFTTQGKRIM